ncbi:MAG TPA: hypothetical protein PKI84_02075 [Methanofastidiosum sp.]|nr:hypothetical protein [Methanofastidiosum sp.]
MPSIETLLSQYWMIIFSGLIVLLIMLIFLVRFFSNTQKTKSGIPNVRIPERISIFDSKPKTIESDMAKEDVRSQVYSEAPPKPIPEATYELPKVQERKKINSWADFIIEIDNLSNALVDAKSHEYFKMSQMYRDLTRFYFDNIQNPNIEKTDMDNAWKKLESCYSRIQKLLQNI